MLRLLVLCFAMCWAGAAMAGDKVELGPAPAWVKPIDAPAADGDDNGAAIRFLLFDQQSMLTPGSPATYFHSIVKIQTPQGLTSGNISLPWRPDLDTLTMHTLAIHRGDQRIDVLASGQTFTILRRESNLESATLDGVFTANIQPEGLQVGDIVEIAYTTVSRDPTLGNHVERIGGGWNGVPFNRVYFSAQWPSTAPVRLRQTQGVPPINPVRTGAMTGFALSLDNLQPLILPKRAPPRFQLARRVELSDFQSWDELAALVKPLFDKAAIIPSDGPLRSEIDRIKAGSRDPKARAEAALAMVEDRVRYVALVMGTGNYVPADATATWSRRYGDCKAKTALLLGMLRELGVPAEAVLVNATFGDGIDQRLPMMGLFNHVVVRATIGGRAYWLDGTRTGDRRLDQLAVPSFGWGLPLVPRATLVRIQPPPLEIPNAVTDVSIDSRAGLTLPAPIKVDRIVRGDAAYAAQRAIANLSGEARDSALRNYWKREFPYVDVKSATASYDPDKREQSITMEGSAKLDWNGGIHWIDDSQVGSNKADFDRDPGPDKDAPYAVPYPGYTRNSLKMLLPPGVTAGDAEVNETVAGLEFRRHATFKDNVFTLERSQRSIAPEFPASEASAAQEKLRALWRKAVALRAKDYTITDGELTTAMKLDKVTAQSIVARGSSSAKAGRFEDAMADFNRAITMDPNYALAYAARGMMMLDRVRTADATADFDRALKIDPDNELALMGRGWIAMSGGRLKEALALYDKTIAANPKNPNALAQRAMVRSRMGDVDSANRDLDAATTLDAKDPQVLAVRAQLEMERNALAASIEHFTAALAVNPNSARWLASRAEAYRRSGDREKALTDIYAALGISPNEPRFYLIKAEILRDQGKDDEVLAIASEVVTAAPDNSYAHVVAAHIYDRHGRRADALRELDRAIAIQPQGYVYLNRAMIRPKSDRDGRRKDLDEVLRLEPARADALYAKADLEEEIGDYQAAATIYSTILTSGVDPTFALARRGIDYLRLGKTELARKDLDDARSSATSPDRLNNLCFAKAAAGLELESALADCNAALSDRPDTWAFLDSRALVLLRLGRFDASIADYNRVVANSPTLAPSIYGRGIAWARKGNRAKSQADIAAALKLDPRIGETFVGYGIQP